MRDKDGILLEQAYNTIHEKSKDYDGDGKVESPEDEYKGSKDKAIKKAEKAEKVEERHGEEDLPQEVLNVPIGLLLDELEEFKPSFEGHFNLYDAVKAYVKATSKTLLKNNTMQEARGCSASGKMRKKKVGY